MESFFSAVEGRWPAGREDYHFHVLLDTKLARKALAVPYGELTHSPGLAPVKPEWMHITVEHLPPVEAITPDVMREVAQRVRERCRHVGPFEIRVRRPELWSNAVVCSVYPGPKLRALWALVRTAEAEVTGKVWGPQQPMDYYPHLSIAYAFGPNPVDNGKLRAWLSDHDLPEPTTRVTALTLVKQSHNGREITWRVIDTIPLGKNR